MELTTTPPIAATATNARAMMLVASPVFGVLSVVSGVSVVSSGVSVVSSGVSVVSPLPATRINSLLPLSSSELVH